MLQLLSIIIDISMNFRDRTSMFQKRWEGSYYKVAIIE